VCGALIVAIVRRQAGLPVALTALLAWLWNPLLLISTALGAHNDVLMLAFTLLALLLSQRERWLLGLIALGLAAHVKLTALLLLPALGVWLVRRAGWRRALAVSGAALLLGLPISWLLYAPLGGWATLPRMLRERTMFIYNSPANIVYHALQRQAGWPELQARQIVTLGSTLIFAAIAALLLWRLWRATPRTPALADERTLWLSSLMITLAYLIVGSFWFQSWYVLWALALAALLPASGFTRTLLPLYCLGALCSNLSTDFLNQDPARHFDSSATGQIMVAVLLTPLVCGLIGAGLRRRRGRRWLSQRLSVRIRSSS
jgi:alpha-1,6-mannosyltransferase